MTTAGRPGVLGRAKRLGAKRELLLEACRAWAECLEVRPIDVPAVQRAAEELFEAWKGYRRAEKA